MAIINFNKKKEEQFQRMYNALKHISEGYYPVEILMAVSEEKYGMHPDDAVAHAYANMQSDAKKAIRNIKIKNNNV
jgi:hypothetical protein